MEASNEQVKEVIKKVTPAVISIVITKDMPKVEGFYKMPLNGKQYMVPKFKKGEKEAVKIGGGSGFFVSSSGIVLTNSHVVQDPKAEYTAFLDHDEENKRKLKVIARDPIHDIAICKIEGTDFPYLELGESSDLELGEYVVAVGNALGEFSNTVSLGIISGLSRFITAQHGGQQRHAERLRGLIQTDAAINPGNSGGPLVNLDGKVIGLNTAVVFGAQNIGFSIPIDQAKKDIEDIKQYGHVRLPFLGVRYLILDEKMKQENDLPVDHGALIMRESLGDTAVIPGSSADKAGLKEFDIILEVDGKKITPELTIQDVIQEKEIGDTVTMKVLSGKKEKELKVELEEKRR
ncbi:MAG: trypsin-like peptidase domain-containing protein [Candidatus Spechtbacterales bacterium]|nr:trypsin-like peptidase domain-containing protein [Candidatus Spechtbacterales bacterium]